MMAADFLEKHRLYLTPLSPLHLGTGETYEPTAYVVDDGIMYVFDPEQVVLNETQLQQLNQLVRRDDLLAFQRFFRANTDTFKQGTYKAITCSTGFAKEYDDKLGRGQQKEDNAVLNRLEVACMSNNPVSHQPYIPGSALKGCLRTAFLDQLTRAEPPSQMIVKRGIRQYEAERLGSFASDVMRLFKSADLMPGTGVGTHIVYAVNKHKQIRGERSREGLSTRHEAVVQGQYRAFWAECTLQHLLLAHQPKIRQADRSLPKEKLQKRFDMQMLAQAVNAYHRPRWKQESQLLSDAGLIDQRWLQDSSALLESLQEQLQQGRVMLLRLGKHGGSDSKTLTDWRKKESVCGTAGSKTIWLASEESRAVGGLLPFGWALLEIDPVGENLPLQDWCKRQGRDLPDVYAICAEQASRREILLRERTEALAAAAQAEQLRRDREAQEAADKAARWAKMGAAERFIVHWQECLAQFVFDSRNQTANTEFYQSFCQALQQAAQDYSREEQQAVAAAFAWSVLKNHGVFATGKREKEIKAVLRGLRGE